MKIVVGQCLDMLSAESFKENQLEKFTIENYRTMAINKTAYLLYHCVCLAMRMVIKKYV